MQQGLIGRIDCNAILNKSFLHPKFYLNLNKIERQNLEPRLND